MILLKFSRVSEGCQVLWCFGYMLSHVRSQTESTLRDGDVNRAAVLGL